MEDNDQFDLSNFLTDSLNLVASASPITRSMCPKTKDYYKQLVEQDPLDVLGENNFKQLLEIPQHNIGTPIQEFFRDTNILITGGTGFIGKVLTQKLVRSIPHLGHVYLLIRSKRGQTSQQRFSQALADPVFRRMKIEVPQYWQKISCIKGDIEADNLGLSETDRQLLLDSVNVVFHSAADVRFIEPLRVAVQSNVMGSWRVLQLAKGMRHLKSYVHVSTAYSQCVNRIIEEKIPKTSINYKEILLDLNTMTDEEIELATPRLLQGWPNTYTFSKALCENMIQEEYDGIPICIFRPSVIWPTYKEPVRGWIDNLYGPVGIMVGVALGMLHHFRMDPALGLDIVPADYVVNAMIAAAASTGTCRDVSQIPIFNFTASPGKPMCWKTITDESHDYKSLWPYSQAIWGIGMFMTTSQIIDEGFNLIQKFRGSIVDRLLELAGNKPRLMRTYEKIDAVKPKLHYFLFTIWEFRNDNVLEMWNNLTEEDKREFNFDVRDVDIKEHLLVSKLGVRYYYLKESMETLSAARIKHKRLQWVHNSFKIATGVLMLKLMVYVARVLHF